MRLYTIINQEVSQAGAFWSDHWKRGVKLQNHGTLLCYVKLRVKTVQRIGLK